MKLNDTSLYGIYASIISSLMYVLGDMVYKSYDTPSSFQMILFVNTLFLIVSIGLNHSFKLGFKLRGNFRLIFFRAIFGFSSGILLFYLLKHISLADVTIFAQTSAIFAPLLAFVFLKEHLNRFQVLAIIIGFMGIVLMIKPSLALENSIDYIVGVLFGLVLALAYIGNRELRRHYGAMNVTYLLSMHYIVFVALIYSISDAFGFHEVKTLFVPINSITPAIWMAIVIVSLFYYLGVIFKTKSYMLDRVGVASIASYSKVPFALIAGWIIGDQIDLGWMGMVGAFLIIISGVLLVLSKRRK